MLKIDINDSFRYNEYSTFVASTTNTVNLLSAGG